MQLETSPELCVVSSDSSFNTPLRKAISQKISVHRKKQPYSLVTLWQLGGTAFPKINLPLGNYRRMLHGFSVGSGSTE